MRMLMCQFWRDVFWHAANSQVAENILVEAVQGRASGAALLNNMTSPFGDEKGCCLPRRKPFWHGYMFWLTQLPAAECIDLFGLDEMCRGSNAAVKGLPLAVPKHGALEPSQKLPLHDPAAY